MLSTHYVPGAQWLPYVTVTDCDATPARAERAGGTVRLPAMDMPEVGRFGQVVDPHGAAFAVITPPSPAA